MIRSRRLLIPALFLAPTFVHAVDVSAQSAIVIDAVSGKILYSKNADTLRFPASTTKVMTGMLLVEHCTPDEEIVAPPDIETVKEASMHLRPGEKVKAKDMLYAIMLRSANDGCYATAIHIAGSVPKFADMMNQRALEAGCTHTHFANPNGLHDKNHYTTAHDLAMIGRAAMRYQWFRDAVKTIKIKINRSVNWQDLWMINHDKWLRKDPTADGIKTGWTIPAGRCFVGSASRQGWRVITVVMKCQDWQKDHQALLDWSFKTFAKHDEVKVGELVGEVPVTGGMQTKVQLATDESAYAVEKRGQAVHPTRTLNIPPSQSAPISKGQHIGELILKDSDGFEQKIPLVATSDVSLAPAAAMTRAAATPTPWVAGGLLVGLSLAHTYYRRNKVYGKSPAR